MFYFGVAMAKKCVCMGLISGKIITKYQQHKGEHIWMGEITFTAHNWFGA